MIKPLIKICGLRTPEHAYAAAKAGADYIGIVFHPLSKRYVDLNTAKTIADVTRAADAIPVAVFVNETAAVMDAICTLTGINVIQLHGKTAKQAHHLMSNRYQRIYVQTVSQDNNIQREMALDPHRDFLLFDSHIPGSGTAFNWNHLQYKGDFRIGVAGGLTPGNVTTAISIIQPHLVDVSSGVENALGQKDICLIKKFIATVRGVEYE